MTISLEQQTFLNTLNLKEGSELHKLAVLLLEAPNSKRDSKKNNINYIDRKTPWNKALEKFCELARYTTHQSEYTPLTLFLHIAHLILNPLGLLAEIKKMAQGTIKPKTPGFDIGLYSGQAIFILINKICENNNQLFLSLFNALFFSPDLLQQQRLFAPVSQLNQKTFLLFLQKLCMINHDPCTYIIEQLLKCQPTMSLDVPLILPIHPISPITHLPLLPEETPKTLCELAIYERHYEKLNLFIPRTHIQNRFNALKFALILSPQYTFSIKTEEIISLLLKNDDLLEKISTDGQDLLKFYIQQSEKYHELKKTMVPKDKILNDNIIRILLNVGCQYSSRIMIYRTSETLLKTSQFLNDVSNNRINLQAISSKLHNLQLLCNARHENGSTVFFILFNSLMQSNPQHFNTLLGFFLGHPLKNNTINSYLKSNDGQTIHSLPYLNTNQILCLNIARQITQAKVLHFNLNTMYDPEENEDESDDDQGNNLILKEKEKLSISLKNKIEEITVELKKLPEDNESKLLLYFNILILHTTYTDNIVTLLKTAVPWIAQIERIIDSLKGVDIWHSINNIILFVLPPYDIAFSEQLQSFYMNMIKNLLINSKKLTTLQVTEVLKDQQIVNPYQTTIDQLSGFTLDIIHLLVQHDLSPDVIINAKGRSLLHAVLSTPPKMQTEKWTSVMDVLMDKLEHCSTTLALPNELGNTPLHIAITNTIPLKYISKLINVIIQKKGRQAICILNQEGMSPFYLAIKASTLGLAHELLKSHNISVLLKVPQLSLQPIQAPGSSTSILHTTSAFILWAQRCTNFKILHPMLTEPEKTVLRTHVRVSLNFAIALLQKGCHYFTEKFPRDKSDLLNIRNKINKFREISSSLWNKENVDPFIDFTKQLNNLSTAWKMVENIENGFLIPYSQLYPFIKFPNTRRFSDDKTMLEIIFKTKKTLETELSKMLSEVEGNQSEIIKKRIAGVNTILSSFILDRAHLTGSIDDEALKNCAEISNKILNLKQAQKKWLQSQTFPKQERKEHEEIKENNEHVNSELSLIQMGREIYLILENFEFHPGYNLFKSRSYFEVARCLFATDKTFKHLKISQTTLTLVNDNLKRAIQLSRLLAVEDMSFRDPMVSLKAIVSPYLPDSNGYDKLNAALEKLISHQEELKFHRMEPHTLSEIDDLLSVHADGNLNLSKGRASICRTIPAALVRSNKLIDALKESLKNEKKEKIEALAREQGLQEKIAHLEQQLLETMQKKSTVVLEQPVVPFLPPLPTITKKRPEEAMNEEENIFPHQMDKRQKTIL